MNKILIVDDDQSIRELLSLVAGQFLQCEFDLAENGLQAIEKVSRHNYDLLIIDIFMPEINGIEVIKTIKALCRDLPIIITTDYGNHNIYHEIIAAGADQIINKPFSLKKMIESAGSFVID